MEIQIPDDLKRYEECILEWLAYKKEKRQSYKPRGLKQLWNKLRKLRDIPSAIEFSMGCNYAGVFDDNKTLRGGPGQGMSIQDAQRIERDGF